MPTDPSVVGDVLDRPAPVAKEPEPNVEPPLTPEPNPEPTPEPPAAQPAPPPAPLISKPATAVTSARTAETKILPSGSYSMFYGRI